MTDQIPYQEYERVTEQLQASEYMKRRLEVEVARLKKSLSGMTEDDPLATDVKELLQLWKDVVKNGSPTVKADLTSTRAPKVKAALKRRKNNGGKDICRKAILGIVYDDWAMGRIKKSQGKCFNDIAEHILNTDGDIEKWAEMYDREQAKRERHLQVVPDPERKPLSPVPPINRVLDAFGPNNWPTPAANDPDKWSAKCPAHDDSDPSLSIHRAPDGKVLLYCWAGCETEAVLGALGLGWRDLFSDTEWDAGCVENVYRGDPRKRRPHVAPEDAQLLRQIQSVLSSSEARAA